MAGLGAVRLDIYARAREVWAELVAFITERLSRARVWLEEDSAGSIWFLAFVNVSFLAAVAAFAAWNIEVLGGKKWSGPKTIVQPVLKGAAPATKVVFRRPEWNFPGIKTSYSSITPPPSFSTTSD